MATKGSRKSPTKKSASKKGGIDAETFAYDIMSYVLPLCGLPKEKIKSKERKQNKYRDSNYVVRASAIVLNVALAKRDEWKAMFESRYRSSGLDTPEKIEKYLKSLLSIAKEFRLGNSATKVYVSLAAYSEIMLFLNYKGVEFDFEQMLILWSRCFTELVVQKQNVGELFKNLFALISDPTEFIKWITAFVQKIATPYGCRDDVSQVFSRRSDRLAKLHDERSFKLAEMLTRLNPQSEPAAVLPECFESSTVLPGDRESSPELPDSCESSVRRKEKESKTRSSRTRGGSKPESEGRPAAVLPESFESSTVLPGDRESSPELPDSCESSVRRKEKESKTRSSRTRGGSKPESEGRPRRKTTSELELEDRLGLMNLSRDDSPQKKDQKGRKPKDRKSY